MVSMKWSLQQSMQVVRDETSARAWLRVSLEHVSQI